MGQQVGAVHHWSFVSILFCFSPPLVLHFLLLGNEKALKAFKGFPLIWPFVVYLTNFQWEWVRPWLGAEGSLQRQYWQKVTGHGNPSEKITIKITNNFFLRLFLIQGTQRTLVEQTHVPRHAIAICYPWINVELGPVGAMIWIYSFEQWNSCLDSNSCWKLFQECAPRCKSLKPSVISLKHMSCQRCCSVTFPF